MKSEPVLDALASTAMPTDVLVSEVGPRDGLQSVKAVMPTAIKLQWIDSLYAAGVREIEVGSFVPARLLPQMADTEEVVRHALTLDGLTVMALTPNLRGAEADMRAGVHKLAIPVSASAAHSLANVRKTPDEMLQEVRRIAELRAAIAPTMKLETGIATAFGCTLQGRVDENEVLRIAVALIEAGSYGAQTIYVTDSAGYMLPEQVRESVARLRSVLRPETEIGFHGHHNLGMGIANSLAAIEEGASRIDGSVGGLGAGAGNTPLEVFVAVCERMGIETGGDLFQLMDIAQDQIFPMMDHIVRVDRSSLTLGFAGVYSTFLLHAERASQRFGIPTRDILVELGRRKMIAGQEDMIIDTAMTMAKERVIARDLHD